MRNKHRRRSLPRIVLSLSALTSYACGIAEPEDVMELPADTVDSDALRLARPRLLFEPGEVPKLRGNVRKFDVLKTIYAGVTDSIPGYLAQPRPTDASKFHDQSPAGVRENMRRVMALAGAWVISGDVAARDRAKQDALDIAAWPTWGDYRQFLSTASTMIAVSIAYDWLYSELTPAERTTLKSALITKGLRPGLVGYNRPAFWIQAHSNWAQVCNAGMVLAALAIADSPDDAALVSDVLARARTNMTAVFGMYAPDGGMPENITYNAYGLEYSIYMIEAVKTALGADWGLLDLPGVSLNNRWRMHMVGPTGKVFNFGDQNEGIAGTEQSLYFAEHFDLTIDRDLAVALGGNGLMTGMDGLLFSDPHQVWPAAFTRPKDFAYRGIGVATLRSAWNDPNAYFVGLKGGDNTDNHSHLDLGSVVFDALGERWGIDPGQTDYSRPNNFSTGGQTAQRWKYYRARTEGHNTLAISGTYPQPVLSFANQFYQGVAPLVAFKSSAQHSFAVVDLTNAYKGTRNDNTVFDTRQVQSAHRGVALLDGNKLLVQDDVRTANSVEAIWQWHTNADVTIDANKRAATLTQNGKTMRVKIIAPNHGVFELATTAPPPPDSTRPNGKHNLIIRMPITSSQRIAVVFAPAVGPLTAESLGITALQDWIAEAPLH